MAGQGNKNRNSKKSSKSTKKNRGPKHGHGNKSRGGGTNAYSSNPTGMTFSEAMKLYGVDNKTDLQDRMRYNPAETTGFYNLIEDKKENNTNNTNNGGEPVAGNLDALNKLYQSTVGRDVDKGGFDYWNKQLNQGTSSIDKIKTQLMGSTEYKDRAAAVAKAGDAGIAESELDKLSSAYKGQTASMADQHRAAALASVNLGGEVRAGNVPTYSDMFNEDGSAKDTWKGVDDWNLNKIKELKAAGTDTGTDTETDTETDTGTSNWYDGYASGADWLKANPQNTDSSSSKWDDFSSFMEALGPLMGGGGYGYPNMGYGGGAPGGVASANPYGNMMNFMNAFKTMGSGKGGSSLQSNSLSA